MKIMQIMPEFGLAGAEIMCENLTYELKKLGHEVIVISMYDYHSAITERLENAGVDVRYLGKKSGLDLSMIGRMRKIFRSEKPDAIHTHIYVTKYAIPAAILSGVKRRVHTVHNVAEKENGRFERKLNKIFYKFFGVIPVALSSLIQETVVKEYGLPEERVPVVLNGVDLSKCIAKTDHSVSGELKILHIGRFYEQKNHAELIKGFEIFNKKHPGSELYLIGEGELRPGIEEYATEHGLETSVKFLGQQSNVYNFLHEADIFVLPSVYEGIPMTLIEAMGTALPIVASNVGGIPDMITDWVNGILCEPNARSIADALEKYCADEDLRRTHGMNALERSQDFSAAEMAKKYASLYANGADK